MSGGENVGPEPQVGHSDDSADRGGFAPDLGFEIGETAERISGTLAEPDEGAESHWAHDRSAR